MSFAKFSKFLEVAFDSCDCLEEGNTFSKSVVTYRGDENGSFHLPATGNLFF